jgi:hypothetical protein
MLKLGLIAGNGRFPFLLLDAARAHGLTLIVAATLAGSFLKAQSPMPSDANSINVYDGFESPSLGNIWDRSRFVPDAIVMEKQVVRAGEQAIAVTVRPGNMFMKGLHGYSDSERSELMEARSLVARQGDAYEYSFSMFFPADFPIVPTRLVIAQWKQYCPIGVEACSDDSPVLALRYIDGTLSITQDLNQKFITLFEKKAEFRNRWLDFRVQARFAPDQTGRVKAWLDGDPIVDYRGITADAESAASGYPATGHFYFKMGLYRNVMIVPMTVYIDEYRKRVLRNGEF